MRKLKILVLLVVCALTMQIMACASPASPASLEGRYLMGGGCTLNAFYGYVTAYGHTDAYEDVDSLKVELILYQETFPGFWEEIWRDTKTGSNDFEVTYPSTRVNVDVGYYYMLEAVHTVTHNGVTESNYSETDPIYVL